MPIYEYRCDHCQCDFEHLQLSDREPDPACPSCCGQQVHRLVSAGSARPQGIARGKGGFSAPPPTCRPSGG
jgi:putative FmdB family regulatory protein